VRCGAATTTTAVITVDYTNGAEGAGGVLDFNDTWVTDNHVFNYYTSSGNMYPPASITITYSDGYNAVQTSNVEDVYNQSLGLASPYNVLAPYGSSYDITVVHNQTNGQSATVLSAWDPADAQFGDTTQNVTLNAIGTVPPYDPYPDPSTNIYNGFSPIGIVGPGWSGTGIWNSKNHLLAMVEGGDSATNELYGFNGQDIINFCSEYGINYSESSGT